MPYTTYPPDMVYPDTPEGRQDGGPFLEQGLRVEFCNEYKREKYTTTFWMESKNACGNRRAGGSRPHNWCYRCMAGFPIWFEDDPNGDSIWTHDTAIVST